MYESPRTMRPLTLILLVAIGIVVGGIALSAALWILGMLAGLVFAVLRLAVLVALAGAVIWGAKFLLRDRSAV